MIISIDGIEKPFEEISYSESGFGSSLDLSISPYKYEIRIHKNEFRDKFLVIYDECISDLKLDDEITGVFDPPYPNAQSYPSLEKFLNYIKPQYLFDFIDTFLKFDIFSEYFSEYVRDDRKVYILTKLESIKVENDEIILCGVSVQSNCPN